MNADKDHNDTRVKNIRVGPDNQETKDKNIRNRMTLIFQNKRGNNTNPDAPSLRMFI